MRFAVGDGAEASSGYRSERYVCQKEKKGVLLLTRLEHPRWGVRRSVRMRRARRQEIDFVECFAVEG